MTPLEWLFADLDDIIHCQSDDEKIRDYEIDQLDDCNEKEY